jgi:dTDP-4-amino-4,6-dideoxygalactose transaminase
MPYREAFGSDEVEAVHAVLNYYKLQSEDPPYDGVFQRRFQDDFSIKMGGGYALAVSTGSIACFIAVKALGLPRGSEIVVGPATDSGSIYSIVEAGLIPVVCDSKKNSLNANFETIKAAITNSTSAVFIVHAAGEPVPLKELKKYCEERGIKIIEDCSQAPFARFCTSHCSCGPGICGGSHVGTYGDIAAFSTMYRKSLHTGGSGGVVFTKNYDLYKKVVEYSDRGRPKWSDSHRKRDPGHSNVVSLNFNTDEFSCAIGGASLKRIDETIEKRRRFVFGLKEKLATKVGDFIVPHEIHMGNSPFFLPMIINEKFSDKKEKICEYMLSKGIDLVKQYDCIVADWECLNLFDHRIHDCENIRKMKKKSFNLFLNEKYGELEIEEISNVVQLLKESID